MCCLGSKNSLMGHKNGMHNAQYILLQDAKEIWKNEQVVFEKLTFDPLL
jgi:hypothetical protein